MKKVIFILIIFSTTISYSQIIKDFGLKIGGTLSHQNWDYSNSSLNINFSPDNKLGFNFGVFVESSNISFFNVVGELNFIQKGSQEEFIVKTFESPSGTGETKLWKLGLNYLNLSILAKPNLNLGLVKPYLLVGPKIDLELSKSIDSNESFYDEFSKSRIGLKLGVGSEINIINIRFLAEFIYDTDFANLYKNENLEITSDSYDFRIGIYF
ncbi:MAG: PorT family protein [Ignavibacteriae bacterium]|nr:PorT family protein [Ignavibacteriota bacterium]